MLSLPRVWPLWAAILAVAVPRAAQAEDEVRIALVAGRTSVSVGGAKLAIFDADVGDRLLGFEGKGEAVLTVDAGLVVVSATGRSPVRARRVFVEAEREVEVERGVYFGRVEVGLQDDGKLLVVNRLPLETYLLGIVGSEMSPSWPLDALKAQAVAARTYALQRRLMMRAANRPYDLESSVVSQVYKGAERIRPSVIQAVAETRGEVMAFRHDLVEALFHSTCGGHTTSAKEAFGNTVPYLKPRPCKWCRDSERHEWNRSFSLEDVTKKLGRARLVSSKVVRFERSKGQRNVKVGDGKKTRELSPKEIRAALGYGDLYSEHFTAQTKGSKVVIDGRGFGHGVGMCQWGARGMALEGKSYRDILAYYYDGAGVKPIY